MIESIISDANSSEEPLANGETFTGAGQLDHRNDVLIAVKTDQAGVLYADFSPDGTNWDSSLTFNISAGINEIHRLVKGTRYYRTRFTNNSGEDQTYFRLNTSFGSFSQLTAPRNLTVGADADTATVRPTDFKLDQAQGRFSGETIRRKFGHNDNAGNSTNEIIGGLSVSASSFGGFLQTATTVRIKSGGNSNDTVAGSGARSVTVVGLDENFAEAEETINTAGTSASSATTTTFIRVVRAYVATTGTYHGANTGDVIIENGSGGTDLVSIQAGQGQSELAFDTIPAGKTAYLTNMRVDVEGSKEATVFLYQNLNADDVTAPYSSKRLIMSISGVSGNVDHSFSGYEVLPAMSDIWVEAIGPSGGAAITAGFEMVWVDD